MQRTKYKISVVRFADCSMKKEIDKLLIWCDLNKKEALDELQKLAINANFDEAFVTKYVKKLRKNSGHLNYVTISCGNLHGYLGPGGYILEEDN